MSDTLSQIRAILEPAIARADAATPGPWNGIHGDSYCAYPSVGAGNGHHFILFDASDEEGRSADVDSKFPGLDEDATFIANARTDVPCFAKALLRTCEGLERLEKCHHTSVSVQASMMLGHILSDLQGQPETPSKP